MVGTTLSSRVGWLNRLVGDWPVFLSSAMHHDLGDLFAVGDTRSWDVELIDGQAAGWPEQVLAAVMVTIGAAPSFAHRGAIAHAGDLRACWQGPEPPGSTLALHAGLVADVWNPPFRAQVSGVVRRIRTVAYGRADREGVLVPARPWVLEDVQRTPRWLRTAQPADHERSRHIACRPLRPGSRRSPIAGRARSGSGSLRTAECVTALLGMEPSAEAADGRSRLVRRSK